MSDGPQEFLRMTLFLQRIGGVGGSDEFDPRSMTGETITDPAQLRHQLDEVGRTGIATEVESRGS